MLWETTGQSQRAKFSAASPTACFAEEKNDRGSTNDQPRHLAAGTPWRGDKTSRTGTPSACRDFRWGGAGEFQNRSTAR
jgi:hypothetical protein